MANYLLAVSGGVDSVVLLDMWAKFRPDDNLLVAHFDHGIRDDSADDARFVEALAGKYDLEFVSQRVELGPDASEAQARLRRYEFLRQQAAKHQATIVTAHHGDDLIGSMAINILRGTGWRGVAPFGADDIDRPLLDRTKSELYDYALVNHLEYVEDSSNQDPKYLRNKLGSTLSCLTDEDLARLQSLYKKQTSLRTEINQLIGQLLDETELTRQQLTDIDDTVAKELLRAYIARRSGANVMWPAVERALVAVRTGRNGSEHQLGDKVSIWLKRQQIIVGTTRPVL